LSGHAAVFASGEMLLAATQDVHAATGLLLSTGERALVVNGARVAFASGRSTNTLAEWLEEAAELCGEDGSSAHVRSSSAALFACLRPSSARTAADPRSKLESWARELDLARFGELMVFRVAQQSGGLHVVRTRFAEALPLRRMFPREGDAPGADLASVPRAPGSVRRLSAFEVEASPMLVSYGRKKGAVSLEHDQWRVLAAAGFERTHVVEGSGASLWVRGEERLLLQSSSQHGEDRVTLLSLENVGGGTTFSTGVR
jgi:hypothetical protein